MRNGGFLHGRRSYHHRRHAAERHSTHPGSQKQRAAAAGSGPFVQWHGAFSAGAASCGCGHQRGAFAGCGLHGPLAGQRHHGAGRAFHLPPCAGSRRADAGIHFVLRTASGAAWRVETVLPGGCRIGARPVDLHLSGLAQMGVHCREEGARLILTTPAGLHGADITLGFPSVGATETLLLAAAAAQGETVLRGAAREPEISDLAAFLNRCGGCVQARAPAPSGCRADECCIAAALRPWPTASWHPPLPVPARRQEVGWN